jgi:methylglyoxal/glyoxal reductase
VSPVLYRANTIAYFESHDILVSAYKPLNRAASFDQSPIPELATKYSKTPAQVMLRWGLQKGLIVIAKTNSRMKENRDIANFSLTVDEMQQLDALTTPEDAQKGDDYEHTFKTSL